MIKNELKMSTLSKLNSLSFQAFLFLEIRFCAVMPGPVLISLCGITLGSEGQI